jgi:hypothetical protein
MSMSIVRIHAHFHVCVHVRDSVHECMYIYWYGYGHDNAYIRVKWFSLFYISGNIYLSLPSLGPKDS